MEDKHKGIVLFLLVVLFGYWSFRILAPFMNYLLLGLLLAFLVYPVYKRIAHISNKSIAGIVLLIAVFLIVVIPSFWLTTSLIYQTSSAYHMMQANNITISSSTMSAVANSWTGLDFTDAFNSIFAEIQSLFAKSLPGIIQSTAEVLFGLVLVCFVLYYGLKDGDTWIVELMNAVPIKRAYKNKLRREIELATRALFFGQVLTSVLVGLLCGALFALFGIANPVFWGFIMIILSFLPVVGAPIVYVPAGIFMMLNGRWVAGISLIVLCSIVVVVVDNIVRPKFVSNSARIHPLTVIIGAIGGIAFMGFVGFVMGPLILNIFMTLVTFDYDVE